MENGEGQAQISNKDKDKVLSLEKQLSEMKSLIMHKEQQTQ
jgi:hypothetical protein